MNKLLSGFCVLALLTTVAAGCTESPTGRTGERESERPPSASPSTLPSPATREVPPAVPAPADQAAPSTPTTPPPSGTR